VKLFLICILAAFAPSAVVAQHASSESDGVNVLVVIAHPDDDAMFAGSVYKITHTLGGNVDVALVTDGSGGFRYAQLAEPIYGLDLTNEGVARQHLPAIRKRELMAGGQIVGVRNYFFLDQLDNAYTENVDSILTDVWNANAVRSRLRQIMTRVRYDYVFVHLPITNFHAHHRAASILALEAARGLPSPIRPVVLGCFVGSRADPGQFGLSDFREHPDYPITRVRPGSEPFVFDRTQALSPDGRLDYRIVVNWLIAEHRTQGTMQLLVNRGDIERFWFFEMNDPAAYAATERFFIELAIPEYSQRDE
jgi:LmbE family N-acetylglucosaminyl deacetylase